MKKTLLLIAALILTAACAAPPPTANRETAPPPATSPVAMAMTEADAIAKEKAIWDAIKIRDFDAFGNMLADNQIEVTSDGVFDKAGSIAGVKDFEPTEAVFSDWKFKSIDQDAYLVTYTANVKAKFKGKEVPPQSARASSVWVSRGGKWLAIYHQECLVKPPMPPAKASTKSPATASASTAPSPVMAAAGSDAIANEKMVWDLFKAKNWDAFAALLAPDFIEVESDGVYDKAGSVKGVSTFDAAKFELSDFKAVQLDADAVLVTYVAKMAGMGRMAGMSAAGDRHSTIWVNRDGKWLGLFHHGSTQVQMAPMASPMVSPKGSPMASPKGSPIASPKGSPIASPKASPA